MLLHVIDIETTGLGKFTDDILEVGYIRCNLDTEIVGYGSLYFYKPEFKVESAAQQIHGLTREFLEPYAQDFEKNLAILYTLMYDAIIVGKNSNSFDIPFIKQFLMRYAGSLGEPYIRKSIDVQSLLANEYQNWYYERNGMKTKKKGKLMELAEMVGLTDNAIGAKFAEAFPDCGRSGAHNALYDAFVTMLLLRHYMEGKGAA